MLNISIQVSQASPWAQTIILGLNNSKTADGVKKGNIITHIEKYLSPKHEFNLFWALITLKQLIG